MTSRKNRPRCGATTKAGTPCKAQAGRCAIHGRIAEDEPKAKAPPPRLKATAAGKKIGRPTRYSEELGEEICERLSAGESLKKICRSSPHLPAFQTVLSWGIDPKHEFYARYTFARDLGYRLLAEELVEISDDASGDVILGENGEKSVNHARIARDRLRVDTRKWILTRMLPRVYGDKVISEVVGKDGGPVEVNVQINAFLAKLDAIRARQVELAALEAAEAEELKK
jgi:hypothetical protein